MKKNKEGFTLIELLAVIVILAIIALIATPIVLNIINNSRTSAALRSAELYIDTVEKTIVKKQMDSQVNLSGNYEIREGNLYQDGKLKLEIKIQNNKPTGESLEIDTNGKISNATLIIGKYQFSYDGEEFVKTSSVESSTGKIELPNSLNSTLTKIKIYGNSIQNGTPTPDNPVEIESVGDKTVNLFDYKSTPLMNSNSYYQPVKLITENNSITVVAKNNTSIQRINYFIYVGKGNKVTINIPSTSIGTGASLSNTKIYYGFSDEVVYSDSFTTNRLFEFYNKKANTNYNVTKTIVATGDYLVLTPAIQRLTDNYSEDTSILTMSNIQIQLGNEATDYEPYNKYKIPIKVTNGSKTKITNIYLDEPLRKVGNYADYIDFENKKAVRKIGVKIFNGTETWSKRGLTTYDIYQTYDSKWNLGNANTPVVALSNNFIYNGKTDTLNYFYIMGHGYLSITFAKYGTTTATDIKNFMLEKYQSGNPVIVHYKLATPIEEDIPLTEIDIPSGNTTIEVATTTKPSKIELDYNSK